MKTNKPKMSKCIYQIWSNRYAKLCACLFALVFVIGSVAKDKAVIYEEMRTAILEHDYKRLRKITASGIDLNDENPSNMHPLFFAVGFKDVESINVLANAKLNIDLRNSLNQTSLQKIIESPYFRPVVIALLKNGANPNLLTADNSTILVKLVLRSDRVAGNKELIKLVLEYDADPNIFNKKRMSPLAWSISNNQSQIVKLLLKNGADPNLPHSDGRYYPIDEAIDIADLTILRMLLKAGANPKLEKTAGNRLAKAITRNRAAVRVLLQAGADPNLGYPIIKAIKVKDAKLVQTLVDFGAKINILDKTIEKPLILATKKDSYEIVKLLITLGADKKSRDKKGFSALDWAEQKNLNKIAELLSE